MSAAQRALATAVLDRAQRMWLVEEPMLADNDFVYHKYLPTVFLGRTAYAALRFDLWIGRVEARIRKAAT